MEFAQRLQQIMQRNQMTKFKLSKRLDVSPSTVTNWLTGESSPNIDKIRQIASLFHVSTDYLLNGADAPELPMEYIPTEQLERLLLDAFRTASADGKIALLRFAETLERQKDVTPSAVSATNPRQTTFAETGKNEVPQLTSEEIKQLKNLLEKYNDKN